MRDDLGRRPLTYLPQSGLSSETIVTFIGISRSDFRNNGILFMGTDESFDNFCLIFLRFFGGALRTPMLFFGQA